MAARKLPKNEKFLVAFSLAGEQRDLVRSIAEAVEEELGSSNVFLDEWYEHYIAGNDGDLRLQHIYGESCALAVVCVSANYNDKPWTRTEHEVIRARYLKAREANNESGKYEILPIRVGEGEVDGIPYNAIVPDARQKGAIKTAQLIIDRLHLIYPETFSGAATSEGSWPSSQPLLNWSMADHREAREAFSILLQRDAPWRYLSLRGPSEVGKSHITQQMLANALRLKNPANLACGRFDFKGTTDIDAAVKVFVQDLNIPPLPASPRLNERLGHILDALKKNSKPALLIFDTYEAASSEAQDWIEKQLLPSIIRNIWLRVVIVGQRVPERNVIWEDDASPIIELCPPPVADWFEYGKKHRSDLTLEQVETGCDLARNKASLLAQLFGPTS